MKENNLKWKLIATDLVSALKLIEQQSQTLRWRLVSFEIADSTKVMRTEVETLTGLVCNVSRLHGRLEVLIAPEEADDGPIPFDPEVDGLTRPVPATAGPKEAESVALSASQGGPLNGQGSTAKGSVRTYDVIQLLGDTDIVRAESGGGEYPTFELAKAAAIDYLEGVIDQCESQIEVIEEAEERCGDEFDCEAEDASIPEVEGNVQFVCAGAYQADPEVQGRPLPWFVGKTVKLRFPITGRPENGEFMWVAVTSIRDDVLVGTLTNEPLFADQTCGDEIVFRREDILVVDESDEAAQQS